MSGQLRVEWLPTREFGGGIARMVLVGRVLTIEWITASWWGRLAPSVGPVSREEAARLRRFWVDAERAGDGVLWIGEEG